MGGMISFLGLALPNLDAVPRVVSLAHPLPVLAFIAPTGGPNEAFRLATSAATNNAANVKPGPGSIFGISGMVASVGASVFLKFFDTAGVPNPALDVPLYSFGLAFNGGPRGIFSFTLPAGGLDFPTGIGLALVRGAADLDNTPINAGQILGLNIPFV